MASYRIGMASCGPAVGFISNGGLRESLLSDPKKVSTAVLSLWVYADWRLILFLFPS